jgi:protein TonB
MTIRHDVASPPPAGPLVIALRPLASPEEAPPSVNEAPKPVQKKEKPPAPPKVRPVESAIVPIPAVAVPVPVVTPRIYDPEPMEPKTAAPKTAPAPPAPSTASNAPDTWEGKVLAQLNKYRRYPGVAKTRHQQGVPYIRFVMDREGRVLSSRLERSSGFPELDREAVNLPKRASPLPKPPENKVGDTLELVVPVEFFIRKADSSA